MTARALQSRVELWAQTRAPRQRQRTLMCISTTIICAAALFIALILTGITDVDRIFVETAELFGAALAVALTVEAVAGIRNLLRTDLVMLIALYGLIFLEFLFPQQSFVGLVSPDGAQTGTIASLIGFAGIALGRHAPLRFGSGRSVPVMRDMSPRRLIQLFVAVSAVGYFDILLSVHFDLFEAIRQMAWPRFSQAWSRGRLGNLSSLLGQVGLLIYLIPPLAGTVLAQFRRYRAGELAIVVCVLSLTFYKGFAGGTRSVFIIYIITFLVAFLLARPRITARELVLVAAGIAAAALATIMMLEFRKIGLENYKLNEIDQARLVVDFNLINISRLTEVFPAQHHFLGWEIPYSVVIRPVPRALWPGKPTGLSFGIEDALGAHGLTLSATFVGESYMAAGLPAVAVAGLLLGSLAASWNRLGTHLNNLYVLVFYASGFFAASLAMRSVLQVAPALIPTFALWLYGRRSRPVKGRSARSGGA